MIGFVYSGAGFKIGWHHGVTVGLHDKGIYEDISGGTSAGALISALHNYGSDAAVEEAIMATSRISDLFTMDIWGTMWRKSNGLYSTEKLEKLLNDFMEGQKASHQSVCCAINMATGERAYTFNDNENYAKMVTASSSIPGVIKPVIHAGIPYSDGGIREQIPIDEMIAIGCTEIYIIGAAPLQNLIPDRWMEGDTERSELSYAIRAFEILHHEVYWNDAQAALKAEAAGKVKLHFICPKDPLPGGLLDDGPDNMRKLMAMGYDAVE